MTPAQEQKLDLVLERTAQHSVLLAGLKEGLEQVTSEHHTLKGKVIHIEATREGRGSFRQNLLSGLSVAIAAVSAVISAAVALFRH